MYTKISLYSIVLELHEYCIIDASIRWISPSHRSR
jgi:hypothetical protein